MREYAPRTMLLPKMVISFVDRKKLLADLGTDAAGVGFSVVVPVDLSIASRNSGLV